MSTAERQIRREMLRKSARQQLAEWLDAGLSVPDLAKMLTEVAAGQRELTPQEFSARYVGARIETDRHGRKKYHWAGRVGGRYGRADECIGTTQADAIKTYAVLLDEVAAYKSKTNPAATVPTLDTIIAMREQRHALTIAQTIDASADCCGWPGKTPGKSFAVMRACGIGARTPYTVTRDDMAAYAVALVRDDLSDNSISKYLQHLCRVLANMSKQTAAHWRAMLGVSRALWADARKEHGEPKPKSRPNGDLTADERASIIRQMMAHIVKPIRQNERRYRHLSLSDYLRAKHTRRRTDIRKAREVRLFLLLIAGLFQRFTAMRALQWTPTQSGNWFDPLHGRIILHNSKTAKHNPGKVEHLPVNPEIQALLLEHRRRYPDGKAVFALLPRDMSKTLRHYADRAGIVELADKTAYSHKHSGIGDAFDAGVSVEALADDSCISAQTILKHYRKRRPGRTHALVKPVTAYRDAARRQAAAADRPKVVAVPDSRLTDSVEPATIQSAERQ